MPLQSRDVTLFSAIIPNAQNTAQHIDGIQKMFAEQMTKHDVRTKLDYKHAVFSTVPVAYKMLSQHKVLVL